MDHGLRKRKNMTKNKKLNHRELKTILDKFDELPQEFLQEMASQNSMSVPELKRGLQETCYRIEGLSFAHRRSLRREIDRMGAETIGSVERVNRMKKRKNSGKDLRLF